MYVFACLGLGTGIYYFVSRKNSNFEVSAGVEIATKYLLGLGILANFWVLLSLIGLFLSNLVKAIIFSFSIFGIFFNYKLLLKTARQISNIYNEFKVDDWKWKILIILTITICCLWVFSIARSPISDGSGFYLALAKLIASSERLSVLPGYEELTSIGLQGEMHFAALLTMKSPESIHLFVWLTIIAGSIMLLALGKAVGLKRHGQWLALAMVFTSSTLIELSGSGKTDLFATALAFAAYYWAFNISERNESSFFILTGLFTGLALVAKISYTITLIPSLMLILLWAISFRKVNPSKTILNLNYLRVIIGICIAVLPHIIKNTVLFENPFAPFGIESVTNQDWYGLETSKRILLILPFALTFGDYWAQMGNLSPLVLMFIPLIFFIPKPKNLLQSPIIIITSATILGLFCWFSLQPFTFAPRYFMACLLLLIIPASFSAELFALQNKTILRLIIFVVSLIILLTGLYYLNHVFLVKKTYQLISGQIPNCQIDPNHCSITSIANDSLESGERLFANDNFRYWLRPDLIQCGLTTEETKSYLNLHTAEQRWRFIIGRGFRSILVMNTLNPLSNSIKKDIKNIPEWLQVTIQQNQRLIFVKIKPLDSKYKSLLDCKQIHPPAWDIISISN